MKNSINATKHNIPIHLKLVDLKATICYNIHTNHTGGIVVNIITLENVCKHYPAFSLKNVSFSLERGNVYGLIGENGSGKSTVSSIIAGMQPATKGEMTYLGQPWKP